MRRRAPVDWPVLLLILMGGVSFLISADRQITGPQVLWLLTGVILMYGLVRWGNQQRRLLAIVTTLLLIGLGLAAAAPVIVDWLATPTRLVPERIYHLFPLLVSNTVHPNVMASALTLLLPLSFALAAQRNQTSRHIALISLAIWSFMLCMLILTESRGGYLSTAVATCLVFWLSRRWSWALSAGIATIATVWGLALIDNPALARAVDPANWNFRQEVWQVGLQMQADFPFTGVGMGSFNAVAERLYPLATQNNPGAHNLFLQVGLDLGLLGLIAFLAIVIIALTSAWQAHTYYREQEPFLAATAVGLFACLSGLVVHGLVDGTIWGTRGAPLLWLIIGLTLALRQGYEQRSVIPR